MGFLDHSTNNIILDAVLTDKGREFLSRNDGSFNIVKFAFGDDEVDYTIIEKFGRTIGKEKIEKNTPIFEGLTSGQYALKYKLVSISRPNLSKMPTLELAARTSTSSTIVSLDLVTSRNDTVTINQTIANNETIPIELVDQVYQVKLNNSVVALSDGSKPVTIDSDGTATYLVRRNASLGTSGGSGITLKISLKSTLTTSSFTNLSNATDKDLINTVAEVKGLQSGKSFTLPIEVRKS